MTPAARLQAAIDILDQVIAAARNNGPAADTIITNWFRTRRYAGSGDRRAVRELVYQAIRRFGEVPADGRSAMIALADEDSELARRFDGSGYGPAIIASDETRAGGPAMPAWLAGLLPKVEHAALLSRAPLDLRIDPLKTSREAVLAQFEGAVPIDGLANGVRIDPPIPIERHPGFLEGHFEVQDAGSQQVVGICGARAGQFVVDLCAGGGGKTLALASAMGGQGRLIACDIDRDRLARLLPRAFRAGITVDTRLLDGGREAAMLADLVGLADLVLVDAPCTGSGTLRRNPEARWRITPARLEMVLKTQRHVLDLAIPLVKPGGLLVYAVCSLIEAEGQGQVDAFLSRHADWTVQLTKTLTPLRDKTDGFFVARLARSC